MSLDQILAWLTQAAVEVEEYLQPAVEWARQWATGGELTVHHAMLAGAALLFALFLFLLRITANRGARRKRVAKKRQLQMRAVARNMGWGFHPYVQNSVLDSMCQFDIFPSCSDARVLNAIEKRTESGSVTVFDYEFTPSAKPGAKPELHTVTMIQPSSFELPPFRLSAHKPGAPPPPAPGFTEILINTHPRFSVHYALRARDENGTKAMFNHRVLSYYECNDGIYTEADGDRIVISRRPRMLAARDVRGAVKLGTDILFLFQAAARGEGVAA